MKENNLSIQINKPVAKVFLFCITPPNTTHWIPSVISEKTNEWPITIGTVYQLQNEKGQVSNMIVASLKENQTIEWVSENKNYHCCYVLKPVNNDSTMFEYFESVDRGNIETPFNQKVLEKLKQEIERL